MRNIPLDEFSGMVNFPSWSLIVPYIKVESGYDKHTILANSIG